MSNESSAVTVTDMAHVLTPDGINIITAEVVRRLLDSASDADFERAFSCTKDKARAFLRRYELCRMPFWGAHELAQAIRDTDPAHAMRSVELAQKAGELPEVFPPRLGIAWAMHRCLLVHSGVSSFSVQ